MRLPVLGKRNNCIALLTSAGAARPAVIAVLVASCAWLAGCGGLLYTTNVVPAARLLEQAREAGAAERAPYDFYYAQAHLEKAREEAAEASYEDAIGFAVTAERHALRARDIARRSVQETER